MFFAVVPATAVPAQVEPVKVIARTSGWAAVARRPCAGTRYRVQHVLGQDGVQQFDDPHHGQRSCSLALRTTALPGQGGCHLAAGVDRRPVERDDLADHADGLEEGRGVDRALVVEVGRQLVNEAAEEPEDKGQEVDVVRARVGDRLPVLPRLEQSQLVGVFGEDVGGLQQERSALGQRTPAPVGLERAVGRLDRSVHLRGPASLEKGYHLASCRVLHRESVGRVVLRPPVGGQPGFQGCGHGELSLQDMCLANHSSIGSGWRWNSRYPSQRRVVP